MKAKEKRYRGPIFTQFKKVLKLFIKKPKMIYLEDLPTENTVILSNHVGATAPLKLELYYPNKIRFWGAHEMNGNIKSVYKYQSETYYHKKKGWPLWLARIFCVIAAPLTFMFYRGLNLISTYRDARFRTTLKTSIEALKNKQNLIIFPEKSDTGYHDELVGFHSGFVILLELALRQGQDLNIVVAYLNKKTNTYIFDKPVKASTLLNQFEDKKQLAEALNIRCNELGKMTRN